MPDELSAGELGRGQERLERAMAAEAQRHEREIQRVEREYAEDLRKLREDVLKPMERRLEAVEQRPGLTLGRWAVIATAVIAMLALAVQAYGTLRGAK